MNELVARGYYARKRCPIPAGAAAAAAAVALASLLRIALACSNLPLLWHRPPAPAPCPQHLPSTPAPCSCPRPVPCPLSSCPLVPCCRAWPALEDLGDAGQPDRQRGGVPQRAVPGARLQQHRPGGLPGVCAAGWHPLTSWRAKWDCSVCRPPALRFTSCPPPFPSMLLPRLSVTLLLQIRLAILVACSMGLACDPQQRGTWRTHTRVWEVLVEAQAAVQETGLDSVCCCCCCCCLMPLSATWRSSTPCATGNNPLLLANAILTEFSWQSPPVLPAAAHGCVSGLGAAALRLFRGWGDWNLSSA